MLGTTVRNGHYVVMSTALAVGKKAAIVLKANVSNKATAKVTVLVLVFPNNILFSP